MRSVLGIACLFGFVACQPMYGAKAPGLKNPKVLPGAKKAGEPEPAPVIVYKDECFTNFRGPTTIRQSGEAARLVKEADEKLATVPKASSNEGKRDLILAGIDRYRSALVKDPYDAEATLKLALAYDMTLRKGCALALLRRLETLSNTQQFREAAERQKNQVRDNEKYFANYRKDALKEIP